PFAAPNKAMPLEDFYDLDGNAIAICGLRTPQPVIGKLRIEIDSSAPCMHTAVAGVFDGAAVKCGCNRKGGVLAFRTQTIEFVGNRAQAVRDTVYCGNLNSATS